MRDLIQGPQRGIHYSVLIEQVLVPQGRTEWLRKKWQRASGQHSPRYSRNLLSPWSNRLDKVKRRVRLIQPGNLVQPRCHHRPRGLRRSHLRNLYSLRG